MVVGGMLAVIDDRWGSTRSKSIPHSPNEMHTGTDARVFRSSDPGSSWQPFGEGLPNAPRVGLAIEPVGAMSRAWGRHRRPWRRTSDPSGRRDGSLVSVNWPVAALAGVSTVGLPAIATRFFIAMAQA